MSQTLKLKSLTIPSGSANSNVLKESDSYEGARGITLFAPAALDALTFTIEVTADAAAAVPVFRTLQDDTPADIAAPAAGKARNYIRIPASSGFRVHASGNVAADRIFEVIAIFDDET